MNEDELKILKMIEAGTITAEEGSKLLEAIQASEKKRQTGKKTLKTVKLLIRDEKESQDVEVRLPLAIFKAGFKIGGKFSPELNQVMNEINYDEIIQNIQEGVAGEVTTVVTKDGHTIKIYVE